MASSASVNASARAVPPPRDDHAHHLAWEDWAKRAPGQKLTAEKERYVLIVGKEIDRAIELGYIKPEHARKANELTVRAMHGESDINPYARNTKSSAVGLLQQTRRFHERSPLNPASVRAVPLTEEQRMDVATATGFFLRQLAHTPNWHKMTVHEAIYQVQKFDRKDMRRFEDPEITREVVCLSGALYPGQASMVDNSAYSDEEKAKLRCPNPIPFTCNVGGCDNGNAPASETGAGERRRLPPLPKPSYAQPIDLTPKDPMPREAREKWNRAIQTGSTGVGTAVVGMAGGAALGAATAGGVTLVPSGAGLALHSIYFILQARLMP